MKLSARLLLLFSALFLISVFSMPVAADDALTLRVGIYDNSPKIFTDENGDAAGFWPDIIEYIAAEEGWEIEYVAGSWAECLDRLEQNEIDIMPDVAYTEERGSLYDFSNETVYVSWSRVYTREGVDIESVLDLDGKTVAVMQGSVNFEGPEGIRVLVDEFDVDCTFLEVDSYLRVFELVASEQADAGVTSKDFGYQHQDDYNVVPTAIIFQPSSLYFAFPQDASLTPYLIGVIDSHMVDLKADEDSVYYQALATWLGVEIEEKAVIPGWLKWALIGVAGLALLLVGGALLLRARVRAKTKALREEMAQRQQADERITHLNSVLRALRNVNQLITRGPDRKHLIRESCDILVETRGYEKAWILLVDENKKPVSFAASDLGEESPVFRKQMKSGKYPYCVEELWSQDSPFLGLDCPGVQHKGCVLAERHSHRGVYRCRLEYEGKLYGIVGVTLPSEMSADEEEKALFLELSSDISFALKAVDDEERRRQAEGELRQSEVSLAEAQRVAHIGSWELDLISNKLTWSDEVYRIFGLEPQQFGATYEAFLDNIHPDDRDMVNQAYTDSVRTRTPYDIIHRLLLKDGTVKYVNERCETFYDDKGKPIRSLGTVQDITGHMQAEAALRQSEEKLRVILESIPQGVTVTDLEGKIIQVNNATIRLHGYSAREEIIGRGAFELITEEGHARAADNLKKTLETGRSGAVEYTLIRKDGTTFPAQLSAAVVKGESDKPIGFVAVTEDITERHQAEEALRASEEKYKNLVEATSDVIWEADEKGVFTFISPKIKDVLGYEASEAVGKKRTLEWVPKEEVPKWLERFKEINAQRRSFFGFEIPHLHKNGSTLIFEVSGIPLFDGKGDFKGFVGVNRDITERRQMQRQLVITDRLASVGELASGIAHELNNPLTGVVGFSQMLLDKDIPGDVREDVEMVYQEAQRAAQVVKNLLTFARKHPPEKQMLNINLIIGKVLELRAYEQRVNNIKVDSRLADELPGVMADYFQLQQVFLNIIINAEFFMKEAHRGGTLTITTERVGNSVRASFADDGPGIAEESLGHLFDPFFTTKEVGKGTGLGLSICHGIVAEHGGKIYAESKPGEGATFTVELPIGESRGGRGRDEES